ncbi:MAG TPA: FAD-binding protein [Gammaproteobacteria bacterium]|jgi:electron transfer flavoprotein alpha subunit
MSRILVIAEHDGEKLNSSTARAVSCAAAIGGDIDIAVFAADGKAVCEAAAKLKGVKKVLRVTRPENAKPLAAVLAPQIAKLAASYSHVLAPSTTFGKDVLPRAAALLGVPQVSDVMKVKDPLTFERPIYAGNAIVTVKAPEKPCVVATVRTASWAGCGDGGSGAIEDISIDAALPTHSRYIELNRDKTDRPDLQSAPRVVSGGRGVGSKENFAIVYKLADKLGAAVGASRAAVDAGFVPNDLQVGQTGKIIAPDLYIAVGISGAIQHLTGIKDARTIVAINKDPDAPIFQVADLGLVGDLFQILPELEKALEKS